MSRHTLCVVLVVTLGCASLPPTIGEPVARENVRSTPTRKSGPTAFNVRLSSVDEKAPAQGKEADTSKDQATGSVRVVLFDDDTFEYQLTIYNDARHTYVAGHLYRGTPKSTSVVATLFSNESLSGRYIQLRGTGSVPKSLDAHQLLEEMRDNPTGFVLRIESKAPQAGNLQGSLR